MARLLIVEDTPELASLIVETAKARGHDAVPAHTGQHARALYESIPFDAAIVDLLLPDVRGSEVLAGLKERGIPAVAVSGVFRGSRYAKEAVEQHGAKAFFEKPFQMAAVLRAAETAAGIVPPDADEPLHVPLEKDELEELEELAPIEEENGDEVEISVTPSPDEPAAEVKLPFAERDKVWAKPVSESIAQAEKRRAIPAWAQTGTLATTSVPRLLSAYWQARHSGELKLRQGNVVKIVYFESGRPVYAASNLVTERFARFCVRRNVITESDMAAVAALAKDQNLRTGEAMLQLGLLTEASRRALLEDQVKEIIWSTFGWTTGDYAFSLQRPSRELTRLDLFPGDLVLAGVMKTVPLVQLRQRVAHDRKYFPAAEPPYQLHELSLSAPQARLLVNCDGTKTVEDLLSVTDLSERETLGSLHAFELMGLVEPRAADQKKRERISFGL